MLSIRAARGRSRLAILAGVLTLIALADAVQAGVDRSTLSGDLVLVTIAVAALLLLATSFEMPRSAKVSTLVGLGFLAVAVAGGFTYDTSLAQIGLADLSRGDVTYELGIVAKQGLELAGWTLIAVGLWVTAAAAEQRRTARTGTRFQAP
jgi:hypothetical protein